jgi:hypothetical protein
LLFDQSSAWEVESAWSCLRKRNRWSLDSLKGVFHPPVFHTESPTLLGIGWGVIATWWVGAFFAVPMIFAARAGARPTLRASELVHSIASLLAVMAGCAVLSGITGYTLAQQGILATDWLTFTDSPSLRYREVFDTNACGELVVNDSVEHRSDDAKARDFKSCHARLGMLQF